MDFIEVANSQIEKRKRDNNCDVSLVNLYGSYLNSVRPQSRLLCGL